MQPLLYLVLSSETRKRASMPLFGLGAFNFPPDLHLSVGLLKLNCKLAKTMFPR